MIQRRFELHDGLLCYVSDRFCRFYIPKYPTSTILQGRTADARSCLLYLSHEGNGPHIGQEATLTALITSYWWPGMTDDIARYVGSCITCGTEKAQAKPSTGVLSSTSLPAYRPFGYVMIDFAETKKPRQTILLITCCYSRYCVAVPTPDESAESTCRALYHKLFMVHGPPEHIHSDKGTSFTAEATQALMRLTGVSHTFTISRLPRVQGFVERQVQEVKRLIRTLDWKKFNSIDDALSVVLATMNFRREDTYGFSPYELAFGRAPNSIQSLLLPKELRHITRPGHEWIFTSSTLFHALVNQTRIERLQTMEDKYTLAAHPTKIKIGDRVLLAITSPTPGKTTHQVSGPYVVIAKKSHNLYEISDEVWDTGRPLEPNMKTQIRAEMQLRVLQDASDLRAGLPRDSRLPATGELRTQAKPKGRPRKS